MTNDLAPSRPLDLLETFHVFRRRKWIVIVPWAVATILGGVLAFTLPPVYTSTVSLMFSKPAPLAGKLNDVPSGPVNADAQADVMREQVNSSLFLSGVITATGLKNDPATKVWATKSAGKYPGVSRDEAAELFLIDYLRQAIDIKKGRGNVIQIVVEDHDRHRARLLANGVASQFIASSKAAQLEGLQAAQEFSLEQQRQYKRRLDEAEGRLESFRRSQASTNLIESNVGSGNIQRATQLVGQADFEAEDLRERARTLRAQFSGQTQPRDPDLLSGPQVNQLAAQIVGLERQLASAQLNDVVGQDNSGSLRLGLVRKHNELEAELTANAARTLPNLSDDVRQALVGYRLALADLAGVEARRTWLQGQVSSYQRSVVSAPESQIEEQRLVQDAENTRTMYNSFVEQSAIASIAEAMENAK